MFIVEFIIFFFRNNHDLHASFTDFYIRRKHSAYNLSQNVHNVRAYQIFR